jgi:hypothetical protein
VGAPSATTRRAVITVVLSVLVGVYVVLFALEWAYDERPASTQPVDAPPSCRFSSRLSDKPFGVLPRQFRAF